MSDSILAMRMHPSFATVRARIFSPPLKKKGGGAPTGAPPPSAPHWQTLPSVSARARTRLQREPLASRRSTAALATQINAMAQPRPCFLGRAKRGHYPRPLSQSSEAPRRPVVMPADPMPGPPENGVTSPARGNRTRPINRLSPVDDPSMGELWVCNGKGDGCQEAYR
jgi:hypothetical protein